MGIYWGSGTIYGVPVPTYQRVPTLFVYDGNRGLGQENYNLDVYGNPVLSATYCSYNIVYDVNVLYFQLSSTQTNMRGVFNFATSRVTPIKANFITLEVNTSDLLGISIMYGNNEIPVTLDSYNRFTANISNYSTGLGVGLRLYCTAGRTQSCTIKRLYFSN